MRKLDECELEEFGRLMSSEKTTAMLGDRWWPRTAKQEGDKINKQFNVLHGKIVMTAPLLEVFLLGVGKVLRLDRDAWPMGK